MASMEWRSAMAAGPSGQPRAVVERTPERGGDRLRLGGDDGAVGQAAEHLVQIADVDADDRDGAGERLLHAVGRALAVGGEHERVGGGVDERHLVLRPAVDDVEGDAVEERDGGAGELEPFHRTRLGADEDDAPALGRKPEAAARLGAIERGEARQVDAARDDLGAGARGRPEERVAHGARAHRRAAGQHRRQVRGGAARQRAEAEAAVGARLAVEVAAGERERARDAALRRAQKAEHGAVERRHDVVVAAGQAIVERAPQAQKAAAVGDAVLLQQIDERVGAAQRLEARDRPRRRIAVEVPVGDGEHAQPGAAVDALQCPHGATSQRRIQRSRATSA